MTQAKTLGVRNAALKAWKTYSQYINKYFILIRKVYSNNYLWEIGYFDILEPKKGPW